MKNIAQDELYQTVSEFMKSKGFTLSDGSYAERIRRGCNLLTDAINATQRTVVRAREEVDKKLLQLRQCIHEATAPPPAAKTAPPAAATGPGPGKTAAPAPRKRTSAKKPITPRSRATRVKPARKS